MLPGLYCESRAEASPPCFTDGVCGLHLSPVSRELWEGREGVSDPSPQRCFGNKVLHALLSQEQLRSVCGWRITSVLMNKMASAFGAGRN